MAELGTTILPSAKGKPLMALLDGYYGRGQSAISIAEEATT